MCIRPIYLEKRGIDVPCGKCFQCVKRRRNDWYIRCLLESQHRRFTYFGLLTYAEVGQVLVKRDIQLFLKRLRIKGYKFSYLIAGEYGDKALRPHWHCLFFADSQIPFADISKSWRGGYENEDLPRNKAGWIRFEPIRSARSIRYTVKYLYKYDGTNNDFELMISKNPAIGHSFLSNVKYFLENETASFSVNGRKTAMPRYFKRQIFDPYPEIKQRVNDALAAKVAELSSKEFAVYRSLYPSLNDEDLRLLIDYKNYEINELRRN